MKGATFALLSEALKAMRAFYAHDESRLRTHLQIPILHMYRHLTLFVGQMSKETNTGQPATWQRYLAMRPIIATSNLLLRKRWKLVRIVARRFPIILRKRAK